MGELLTEVNAVIDTRDHPRVKVKGDEVRVKVLAELTISLTRADATRWLAELRREARKAGLKNPASALSPRSARAG